MPGQASLNAAQYYAHPRNAFWPIAMAALHKCPLDFSAAHNMAYSERLKSLTQSGIALWDVLSECHRPGSLDSRIDRASEIVNPITDWIQSAPEIKKICFNGKTAAAIFKRHFGANNWNTLNSAHIEFTTLPSTSPAFASMTLVDKAQAWQPAFLQ